MHGLKTRCTLHAGFLLLVQGFFHGLRTIIAREGIAGTYQGVTATIMKQGSNQAIRSAIFPDKNF